VRSAITDLVQELRSAGLPISLAESIDALRAAAAAGIEREALREALAAALVKDEVDRPTYDEVFERFFAVGTAARRARRRIAGGADAGTSARGDAAGDAGKRRDDPAADRRRPRPAASERVSVERKRAETSSEREVERRRSRRRLMTKPFRELEPLESEQLAALAEELMRRFRGRLRRRLRPGRRGRLDFRRTLRRSIARGGVPVDLELRRRRPGRIDVVALCDVSGSVRHAADFFAAILAPCRDLLRSLRVFVFVDHAVEASFELGRLIPHAPVDFHAFSDHGQALLELEREASSILSRNTVLVVLGDARNNRRPARADALARLSSRLRAAWWLVPEPRARWGTGDSAIERYQPHCDEVVECPNAAALVAALDRLTR
jgi:uncharacterized protein with von Willebrand factor type A (vWA) domain